MQRTINPKNQPLTLFRGDILFLIVNCPQSVKKAIQGIEMEIVDFLQLVFLLGLLVAVAILLSSLRATRRFQDKPDKDEASQKNQLHLNPERAVPRPRNSLNRQPARRLAGG